VFQEVIFAIRDVNNTCTKSADKFTGRFIDLRVKENGQFLTWLNPTLVACGQPMGELTRAALPNGKEWLHPQTDR
jgi:hypothetical protein